jgi:histidine ammonia-lyase
MQISASAVSAEALKLTMPASVFSRSTECHNQDVVSMGSHAAQDCLQILDRTETVGAICALAVTQAVDLRSGEGCHRRSRAMHQAIRAVVPKVEADRRQDVDVRAVHDMYLAGDLPIGSIE